MWTAEFRTPLHQQFDHMNAAFLLRCAQGFVPISKLIRELYFIQRLFDSPSML